MRFLSPRLVLLAIAALVTACSVDGEPTPTTEPAPLVSLTLAADGLGDVLIGFPPDTVISDISALVGEPDLDTDWIPSEPNAFGSCPGRVMRAVGWGSLVTIFVNDTTEAIGERFYTYTYGYDYVENQGGVDPRGLQLTTETGIGVGSAVADLVVAYGADVAITGDPVLDVWSFEIAGRPFRGLVTGPEEVDIVTLFELTPGCA